MKVTVNPRIRLMPVQAHTDPHGSLSTGYNLEIRDVRNSDAGDYICQIGSMEPKEIVHTLEILVPPKIDYISPSNKMDIHKGAPIRMECRASGNPTPKIVWSRKVRTLLFFSHYHWYWNKQQLLNVTNIVTITKTQIMWQTAMLNSFVEKITIFCQLITIIN